MERPRASSHYPKSLGEFEAWFPTDADCLGYPEWLRWLCGFVCPACGPPGGRGLGDGRFTCSGCGSRTTVMAGTILDRTGTPLRVWFSVCWHFATGKDGIAALSLERTLRIGSYQAVRAILHRLRSVLIRPDRERLCGKVEVDETYLGGKEPWLSGGRAKGKKILTCIAIEILEPKRFGCCRMAPVVDASAESLHAFVMANVEPRATINTDAWQGCRGLEKNGHIHDRLSPAGRRGARRRPWRTTSRCASNSVPHRTMAAGDPPGSGGFRTLAQLPGRVRVAFRPPPLNQSRNAVLPSP